MPGMLKSELGIQGRVEIQVNQQNKMLAKNQHVRGVNPGLANNIHALKGEGRTLPQFERNFFEPRFGSDFSKVRLHTGHQASIAARALHAQAFTMGRDIFFGAGQFAPGTTKSQRLLAHELTHTIQQGAIGNKPSSFPLRGGIIQRRVSPKISKIRSNLTYGILDWKIFDSEAHEVLMILKFLSDADLRDTLEVMEREGLVERLFSNVSEADKKAEQATLRRISNFRVRKHVTERGGERVETTLTGSCSFQQAHEVRVAAEEAIKWIDNAIALLDSYRMVPRDVAHKDVRELLRLYFKTTDLKVATYIRNQLDHVLKDIKSLSPFKTECHGKWDLTCGVASAYVPGGDRERIVFCPKFFRGKRTPSKWQIAAIVHEMMHTQVGSAHIQDIAYPSYRLFKIMTTEEALVNAASYELFVRHLATGVKPPSRAPSDTFEDCPKAWKDAIKPAIARAQQRNRAAQVRLARLTPARVRKYGATFVDRLGGDNQSAIDKAKKAFNKVGTALKGDIDFQCEPEGGGRCDKGAWVYWYATGDLHICPAWKRGGPEDQISILLSGLYGYRGGVDPDSRRHKYAALAKSCVGETPRLSTILGRPHWRNDYIRIVVRLLRPIGPLRAFVESGTAHTRISSVLPSYKVPPCETKNLPFNIQVLFRVDYSLRSRPAPFTPLRAKVDIRYEDGPVLASHIDMRADYDTAGEALGTKFPKRYYLVLDRNGRLKLKFVLNDPDSSTIRVFEDTIPVETSRPCDIPTSLPESRYA